MHLSRFEARRYSGTTTGKCRVFAGGTGDGGWMSWSAPSASPDDRATGMRKASRTSLLNSSLSGSSPEAMEASSRIRVVHGHAAVHVDAVERMFRSHSEWPASDR